MAEKTKSAKTSRSFSGVVLVMVITVMFVLIIMLLATLSVVSTAQNRYYTKYEENQAYYSARSALDVFTSKMLTDDAYYTYKSSTSTTAETYTHNTYNASTDTYENPQSDPMKQGLALEFEFYKIKSQEDLGFLSDFEESDYVFGKTASIAEDKNYSSDPTLSEIVYEITFPSTSATSDNYGNFSDSDTTATITVEVLSRKFNIGGTYADVFNSMTADQLQACSRGSVNIAGDSHTYTKDELKQAIRAGDRLKDNMRVKITSTVTFMDVESSAVLIYDTSEKPVVNSSNAITSVSDITDGSGIIPMGGASSLSGGLRLVDNTSLAGDIYIIGNVTNGSNCDVYLFGDTLFTVRGSVTFNNVYPHFEEAGSVIYADTFNFTLAGDYGSSGKETNIVASVENFSGDNSFHTKVYGRIFCDTFNIPSPSDTRLDARIYNKVYTNYITVPTGDGSDTDTDPNNWSSIHFSGSDAYFGAKAFLSCAGDIVFAKGFIIDGVKYNYSAATGTMTSEDGLTTYTVQNMPAFTYDPSATVNISYTDTSAYTLTSDLKKQFNLPANLIGRSESTIDVPTTQSIYQQIYKDVAFDSTGEISTITKPTFDTSSVTATYGASGTAVSADIIQGVANGTINDDNYWSYGISWNDWNDGTNVISWWPYQAVDYQGIKSAVNDAVTAAQSTDTAYQTALANYYANYITGAEKAGASSSDLYQYHSTDDPITTEAIDTSDTVLNDCATDIGATQVIKNSGYIQSASKYHKTYGSTSSPIIIDARSNDIIIQLGAESGTGTNKEASGTLQFNADFVVLGDNNVKFYLPDGRNYTFGSTASGEHFNVMTYDVWKIYNRSGTLALGTTGTLTKSPNVYVYAGNNVGKITLATEEDFFSAYIYAPFADFSQTRGAGRVFSNVTYNGSAINMHSSGFCVVGSVICKSYSSANNVGVAYINPDSDDYDYGDPQFNWSAYMYTRS